MRARELGNLHSRDTIIVKLAKYGQVDQEHGRHCSNVGHVPDPLARTLAPILDGGVIINVCEGNGDWCCKVCT